MGFDSKDFITRKAYDRKVTKLERQITKISASLSKTNVQVYQLVYYSKKHKKGKGKLDKVLPSINELRYLIIQTKNHRKLLSGLTQTGRGAKHHVVTLTAVERHKLNRLLKADWCIVKKYGKWLITNHLGKINDNKKS